MSLAGLPLHQRILVRARLIVNAWTFFGANGPTSSAALTFYVVLSLSPLLLFLAAASALFFHGQGSANPLQQTIVNTVSHSLGKDQGAVLQNLLNGAKSKTTGYWASSLGLVVSIYGASGLFQQLRFSVNLIWGVSAQGGIKSFFLSKAVSILMVLLTGTVLIGWVIVDSWLRLVRHSIPGEQSHHIGDALSFLFSFVFWTPVYAAIYKWLPQRAVRWRDVWLGAIVTALAYSVFKYVLSLYFTYSNAGTIYGPAGAVVIILLWTYYYAQVFLFGVALTRAYAELHGSLKVASKGIPALD